jgi:hypothetical protein
MRASHPAVLVCVLLGACQAGLGDKCDTQQDCPPPLVCARDHTCQKPDVLRWDTLEQAKRQQQAAGAVDRLKALAETEQRLRAELEKAPDEATRKRLQGELDRAQKERRALEARVEQDLPPAR